MMLVVAVALSTATYAWFTSNASVSATDISLTAATNGDAALGISYQDGNYTTTIAADSYTTGLNPMAPATLTTSGTPTQSTVTFFTSKIKSTSGDMVFITPTSATPHVVEFTSSDTIYIKNLSTANAISSPIPVTAAITDTKGWLRVGIFTKQGNESVFTLKGVFGIEYVKASTVGSYNSGTKYYTLNTSTHSYDEVATNAEEQFANYYVQQTGHAVYGAQPEAGSSVATFEANTYTCDTSINIASSLAALEVMQVKVIIWTDGTALNDNTQGGSASVALTFGSAS